MAPLVIFTGQSLGRDIESWIEPAIRVVELQHAVANPLLGKRIALDLDIGVRPHFGHGGAMSGMQGIEAGATECGQCTPTCILEGGDDRRFDGVVHLSRSSPLGDHPVRIAALAAGVGRD